MSPSLFFDAFALTLALASLLGARRSPIPAAPVWVAMAVLGLALGGLAGWEWLRWAAFGLALGGLLLPGLLLSRVRALAAHGRYGEAARLLRRLLVVRRSIPLTRWAEVWEATETLVQGDEGPADALVLRWTDEPLARAHREWLIGILWRWPDALQAEAPELRVRAACELGELESAVQQCAQRLERGAGPVATARQRLDWLPALAFSGHVAATEMAAKLLRLSSGLSELWRATALAATGHEDEARAAIDALQARPELSAGLRYSIRRRAAHLPGPPALTEAARAILVRMQREVMAGTVLRLRLPTSAPVTLGLLGALAATFALQASQGGTTSSEVAVELGALLPDGGFPADPMRLLTYAFLHHGALHLGVNAFTIGVVGATVEGALGTGRLLAIYAASVVGAGLAISFFGAQEPTLGASGAAMGLLAALGVVAARDRRTRGTQTGRQIGLAIGALVLLQSSLDAVMPEISFTGHLGGALVGALSALLLVRSEGGMHG